MALYPERFPKTLEQLCSEPLDSSPDSGSVPLGTFNIKSKVDTVPRKPRLALSRYGKRQILRSGSCFDTSERTERLLLTGTLPGSSYKAFKALAEFSTYATKTLTNWLTRRSPGCAWQYVWEYQKRGALHLHLVCELPVETAVYIRAHFKDEWNRILRAICRQSKVDLFAKTSSYSHSEEKTQADVTLCEREPSRYICKYIAKSNTHAKAFGRFPPKTWYQVSRSLLKRLQNRTETYEIEGLNYSQSLRLIEDFKSRLERYDIAGNRRFEGAVLAWSGYFYHPTFDASEWSDRLVRKEAQLLSIETVAKQAMAVSRNYPAARCYMRSANVNEIEDAIANGTATAIEMKTLIATVMQSLTAIWGGMHNPTQAAMFLKSSIAWWDTKYERVGYTDEYRAEIDKICNKYLTA